jgi:hypothetical protein
MVLVCNLGFDVSEQVCCSAAGLSVAFAVVRELSVRMVREKIVV